MQQHGDSFLRDYVVRAVGVWGILVRCVRRRWRSNRGKDAGGLIRNRMDDGFCYAANGSLDSAANDHTVFVLLDDVLDRRERRI
jgi:hypothetical protein